MGSSLSFEQNVDSRTANINSLHTDIDSMMQRINNEANRLIDLIIKSGKNNQQEVCKTLAYHKVDELSSFFPIQTLNGIRYRLGVVPNEPILENDKDRICLDIVNFYLKKIKLDK